MKLVICEKPSVGAAVAAALGVREKKDGYIEGNGYVISWCIGHLVGLAEAAAYPDRWACIFKLFFEHCFLFIMDTGRNNHKSYSSSDPNLHDTQCFYQYLLGKWTTP